MKFRKLTLYIQITFLFSCKEKKKKKATPKCDVEVKTNNGKLCIPVIGSLINGNSNETVKNVVRLFENEDSKTFAFYIDEESFQKISTSKINYADKNSVTEALNEFYYLYQTNNLINVEPSDDAKEKLDSFFVNNYSIFKKESGETYDSVFDRIDFDKTYLVDSFRNIKIGNANSYMLIFKTAINNKELKLINIVTPIVLNNRIYIMSYNKKYRGLLSDFEAKERADYINEQLSEKN